jgi:predicted O-methyltransferase YrrM
MKPRWQILAELIKTHEFRCVAEVGVNRGLNALGVLELCPEIEKMYLIDRSFGVFDSGAFKPYNTKIIGIEATSEFAADYIKNQSLDLVFIDADHSYEAVVQDIKIWIPKIRSGGIIAGHDYMKDYPDVREGIPLGVKEAVTDTLGKVHLEQDELENGTIYIWWKYV